VLKHFGSQSDPAGAPAQHVTLCLECVSFAPFAGAHGGSSALPVVVFVAADGVLAAVEAASLARRSNSTFQARAPPR
jgi:hypothetical protein